MNNTRTERKRYPPPQQQEDWYQYEILKAEYTATATTSAEYDAACRRAAQMAGV